MLVIVTASWRSENIYYAPICFFIYLLLVGKKHWKRCFATALAACVLVVGIGKYNTSLIGTDDYSVMAVINQVTVLVRKAVAEADPSTESALEKIGNVLDIDRIISESDQSGASLYWDGVTLPYTDEEYNDFISAYIQLTSNIPAHF